MMAYQVFWGSSDLSLEYSIIIASSCSTEIRPGSSAIKEVNASTGTCRVSRYLLFSTGSASSGNSDLVSIFL